MLAVELVMGHRV